MKNLHFPHCQCWTVNRGESMSAVQSCEGMKDPPNFYIFCVWVTAGFTTTLLFLLAHYISRWVSVFFCETFWHIPTMPKLCIYLDS